jgi:Recombination endonuclease VII
MKLPLMRTCKTHGVVERYKDGKCKKCCSERSRNKYARKKGIYKQRLDARMQDPAYRVRQADTARRSAWKRLKLPKPTREPPVICECCGLAPTTKKRLALDHDHTTGKFRGWLCSECNFGIGKLGDSLDGLERARLYLLRAEFT